MWLFASALEAPWILLLVSTMQTRSGKSGKIFSVQTWFFLGLHIHVGNFLFTFCHLSLTATERCASKAMLSVLKIMGDIVVNIQNNYYYKDQKRNGSNMLLSLMWQHLQKRMFPESLQVMRFRTTEHSMKRPWHLMIYSTMVFLYKLQPNIYQVQNMTWATGNQNLI